MKHKILSILILVLAMIQPVFAQEGKGRPDFEKFKAMKIAFFTERLKLTTDEAEKFWPVFNEFDMKKDELRHESRKLHKNFMENLETISDEEADKILADQIVLQKKEQALDQEYHEKFKKVLSSKKLMLLYLTEMHFKSYLLHQIRDREGGKKSKGNREPILPGPGCPK